ncbi:hypothetical protein Tco_0272617 [Tanacetum coccineum]
MADLVYTDHISISLDHAPSPPQQDIVMTDATIETTAPEVVAPHVRSRRFRLAARRWEWLQPRPIHRTISLILARLVRHDDMIDRLCDHLEDMSLDRMGVIEYDVETLQARVDVVELRADILQLALGDTREEIVDLRARLGVSERSGSCMITCLLRMEERVSALEQRSLGPQTMPPRRLRQRVVERLVANRVAEAIVEYERNRANPEGAGGAGAGNTEGNIGNVTSSKPTTIHEAVTMARGLVDQAVRDKAIRISDNNKRKWKDQQKGNNNNNHNNTHHHQQNRRQEAVRAYAALAEGRGYTGHLPLCNQCKLHHIGQCPVKCRKCKRLCHQTKDFWSKSRAADKPPTANANA